MDFTAEENFPGLMIFIDFQKAFDTIEWCYLQRCLESFNFGPEFIRWVMTFYNNIQSCVINNGITSDYFTLERRVRQGDPLSPYLFIIGSLSTHVFETRTSTGRGHFACQDSGVSQIFIPSISNGEKILGNANAVV